MNGIKCVFVLASAHLQMPISPTTSSSSFMLESIGMYAGAKTNTLKHQVEVSQRAQIQYLLKISI